MTEVSTRPHAGATKAPARAKAAPTPAHDMTTLAAPEAKGITADKALVATTLAEQLQAIYATHEAQLSAVCSELLRAAADGLENPEEGYAAIYKAAALVYGAIAVERAERPGSPAIAPLEVVHQSLDSASISYNFEQAGCEAMADGIRTGQHHFHDRPTPPIRRMEEPVPQEKGYSRAQMKSTLEFVAGAADNVRNILMMAQTVDENWEIRRLVDAAELMIRHIGASADVAVGVTVVGDLEHWNYGPNFRRAGVAA